MAKAPRRSAPAKSKQPAETPLLEWIAGAVGLMVLIATVIVLSLEIFSQDPRPPQMAAHPLEVTAVEGGYLMMVQVRNVGGAPAAGVSLEGVLTSAAGEIETAEATFDYIADHSMRKGGLMFSQDPRQGQVVLRITGFTEP